MVTADLFGPWISLCCISLQQHLTLGKAVTEKGDTKMLKTRERKSRCSEISAGRNTEGLSKLLRGNWFATLIQILTSIAEKHRKSFITAWKIRVVLTRGLSVFFRNNIKRLPFVLKKIFLVSGHLFQFHFLIVHLFLPFFRSLRSLFFRSFIRSFDRLLIHPFCRRRP